MKHRLLLTLSLLSLASCSGQTSPALSRVTHSSETSSEEASIEEGSVEISSSSAQDADLPAEDVAKFPSLYCDHIAKYHSYRAITKGKTVADLGFMKTEQSIDVDAIKGEYSYVKNISDSDLVHTYHQAYFHQDKALYRDSDSGDFTVSNKDAYLDIYGVDPFARCIEGYEIGEGCVTSVERVASDKGYAYKITFDNEKATINVRIQMKKFGDLKDYPAFSKIEATVTVAKDFTPISIHVDAQYRATKNALLFDINTDCTQDYDVTFSSFDEDIAIEGIETAKEKI